MRSIVGGGCIWGCFAVAAVSACAAPSDYDWRTPLDFRPRVMRLEVASAKTQMQRALDQLRPGEKLVSLNPMQLPGMNEVVWIGVAENALESRSFAQSDHRAILDIESLKALEEDAMQDSFGRMTPSLYGMQRNLAPDDRISVHIFVGAANETAPFPFEGFATKAQLEDWIRWTQAQTRNELDVAKTRVRGLIKDAGGNEAEAMDGIPVIAAEVPVWFLRSAGVNALPEVIEFHERPDPSANGQGLLGYAAHGSMNEASFVGGGCGSDCDGDGLMVGILEQGCDERTPGEQSQTICAGIASQNPRLNRHATSDYMYQQALTPCSDDSDCATSVSSTVSGAVCRTPFSNSTTRYCVFDHPTGVAASIGMDMTWSYSAESGNAPPSVVFGPSGAHNVYYAVANSKDQILAVNWILDTMPTFFINRSQDRFVGSFAAAMNWAARTRGVFYTQAGGNSNQPFVAPEKPTTTTCGDTRNGLCVGWYNYIGGANYNVLSSHTWTGSDPGSSYGNVNGLERPHLLGPGTVATTSKLLLLPNAAYDSDPDIGQANTLKPMSGSSFSAPAVLSAQLQAMEYEGYFSPAGTPLASKAMVLAATVDANSDGAIGLTNRWSGQPDDAKDGAGQIDFGKLKQILDNNRYYSLNLTNSSFVSCGTGCREYVVGSIPMTRSARVSLVWNACSVNRTTSAFLNNDLDLRVQRTITCGGSVESNDVLSEVEMIQVAPSGSATCSASIRVRIKGGGPLNSCGTNGTEPVAVAWAYQ